MDKIATRANTMAKMVATDLILFVRVLGLLWMMRSVKPRRVGLWSNGGTDTRRNCLQGKMTSLSGETGVKCLHPVVKFIHLFQWSLFRVPPVLPPLSLLESCPRVQLGIVTLRFLPLPHVLGLEVGQLGKNH